MLEKLEIQNFAILDQLTIDFTQGFTVITGETGAGKSLVCDAIQLVLGGKSDPKLDIRHGQTTASITGYFKSSSTNPKLLPYLDQGRIMIKRTLNIKGRSKCSINGKTVSINLIKEISESLCHISSQHDSQKLFNHEEALKYIDRKLKQSQPNILQEYRIQWLEFDQIKSRKQQLENQIKQHSEQEAFWKYQIDDIRSYQLKETEETKLNECRNTFKNFGKIQSSFQEINENIKEIKSLWHRSIQSLEQIKDHHENYQKALEMAEHYFALQEDYDSQIQSLSPPETIESIDIDNVESRLDQLFKLKQKYKLASVSELIQFANDLENRLSSQSNYKEQLESIQDQYNVQEHLVHTLALNLHEHRVNLVQEYESKIQFILSDLGLEHAIFKVLIKQREYINETGLSHICFEFSANPGNPLASLELVASGGEISRIFLALQCNDTEDEVSSLIFDEVDTGIGGITASQMADKLLILSKNRQVICISHLAQIADLSDQLIVIDKTHQNQQTQVFAKQVINEEKELQINTMRGLIKQ